MLKVGRKEEALCASIGSSVNSLRRFAVGIMLNSRTKMDRNRGNTRNSRSIRLVEIAITIAILGTRNTT